MASFSFKSNVDFPKTEVLENPQILLETLNKIGGNFYIDSNINAC